MKIIYSGRYEDLYHIDRYAYHLLYKAFGDEGMKAEKGDIVIPTEWAKQNGVARMVKSSFGVVVSKSKKGNYLTVRPDGRKGTGYYWAGFWRKKRIKYVDF